MTREKIKIMFLRLEKKALLYSYQNKCFLITNSDKQELIHNILIFLNV